MPPISMQQLQTRIGAANGHFEWIKTSSLAGVLGHLGGRYNARNGTDIRNITPISATHIEVEIQRLARVKRQKYHLALAYIGGRLGIEIGAVPVRPRMSFREFEIEPVRCVDALGTVTIVQDGRFKHTHRLTWESSDGEMVSLANVRTREWVRNIDQPSGPPFNHLLQNVPYPAPFYHPGNAGSVNGSQGHNDDDHMTLNPGLICRRPLQQGRVRIQQLYEYSLDNVHWHPIVGAGYLLEKGIRNTVNGLRYYFLKTNWPIHNLVQFHFEVEYPIDTALGIPNAYPPRHGFGRRANIADVGGVVIQHVDQA